jgi:hypothetical protein
MAFLPSCCSILAQQSSSGALKWHSLTEELVPHKVYPVWAEVDVGLASLRRGAQGAIRTKSKEKSKSQAQVRT